MIRTRSIREEFALLLLLVVVTLVASYALVELVKLPAKHAMQGLSDVPVAWEITVRDAVKRSIAGDSRIVVNPVVDSAMATIVKRLTPAINDTAYPITLMVAESDDVNAVTFPGGLIVVFTPLIRLASSPEELAGVIAHEIGHVEHRDPLKQMVAQIGLSTIIGMANGGKAPPMVEKLVRDFIDVRYTQAQESAADSFAVSLLANSGIDPGCLADFLERMDSDSSTGSMRARIAEYVSTHPGTPERIRKAREASARFDRATAKPLPIDWTALKRNLPSIFR